MLRKRSNLSSNHAGKNRIRLKLELTGTVQGVGFRPFVFNLARKLKLAGWVRNDMRGLFIEVEGGRNNVDHFLQQLRDAAPPVAEIRQIERMNVDPLGETEFRIAPSENSATIQPKPSVMPDLATCPSCLSEIQDSLNRRYRYPFTSCTLCGPRWSIIEAIPYDRPNTAMAAFPLCPACQQEYENPGDRRFHHQANACPACGPRLALWDRSGTTLATQEGAFQYAIAELKRGKIVALKGIGGFQLLVDAGNEHAVRTLRNRKQRPSKPFALLCADLDHVAQFCSTTRPERELLQSSAAPIVLMTKKTGLSLAESIAPGNPYLGIMLPCSVLHHLLIKDFGGALICTSGNLSGDPICKNNKEALDRLHHIADLFLVHDRTVVRALDDSVAQVVAGETMLLRRARGYAPKPLEVKTEHYAPAVLAVGAHIKNTVALSLPDGKNNAEIILSAHLGDLDAPNTRDAFKNRISNYMELYRLQPQLLLHDLHPDYYSSQFADSLPYRQLAVQHHWAHIAACMAEHQIERQVLGVAWDGIGLGDNGGAWGGEFILANRNHYRRIGHLLPFPLPGGDKAALDVRRAMLGAMYVAVEGDTKTLSRILPKRIFKKSEKQTFISMIKTSLNTVDTTSAGRLFDAVSCLLGLCGYNSFEGEAAMMLQFAAESGNDDTALSLPIKTAGSCEIIDWRPLVLQIVEGRRNGTSTADLARLFHQTMVKAIVEFVVIRQADTVVLTGGCFQNRLLLQHTLDALRHHHVKTYWPQMIPANDGGVAFGQAVIGLNYFSKTQPRNPPKNTELNLKKLESN